MLRWALSVKPQASLERQGVRVVSMWGVPAYLAVQKGEEGPEVRCMCGPLCQCVPVKEGTGRKQW